MRRVINGIYTADDVAAVLQQSKKTSDGGWLACCPAHNDKTPSLAIHNGNSGGVVVRCFAGCSQSSVIDALKGLGAWPEYEKEHKKKEPINIVAEYNYTDEHSELIFQVLRLEPKSFRQRMVNKDGGWIWNLKALEKFVPYRLPSIKNSTGGICLCEGEKDADNLAALGFITTTFAGGAGAWRDEYLSWFEGRRVYVLQDNDEAGIKGAKKRAEKLLSVASQVKIISFPNAKDVSDWIQNGGTKDQFIQICKSTPEYGVVDVVPDEKFGVPAENYVSKQTGLIAFAHQSDKGKPLTTIETTQQLLDAYNIAVRYNVTKKEIEVNIPGSKWLVDNADNCALAEICSLATRHGLVDAKIKQYLIAIADQNAYNPFANWIESQPWDGVSRLDDLYQTLDCQNEDAELGKILLKRWLISGIEANYNPNGVSNSSVLVLQGDQYGGKTTWFWKLVGENREFGREACILNPAIPDSVYQAVSYAVVELGELDATFRRADIAALKGFITKDFDRLRRPYAATDSKFPRRTIFFATVNPIEFLHDETGNRRFWTLKCGSGLIGRHKINAQQVWAEAKHLWDNGQRHTLTKEEAQRLAESNKTHEAATVVDELIERYLLHDAKPPLWDWKTATEVLIDIGVRNPTAKDRTACSASLRTRYKDSKLKGATRYYLVPPARQVSVFSQ